MSQTYNVTVTFYNGRVEEFTGVSNERARQIEMLLGVDPNIMTITCKQV